MAKNNNLTDFLTGVADAIRTKKGTTDLINPQDFESEILSIETGGSTEKEYKVKVYDYDGTILLETEGNDGDVITLPEVPTHERLIFQEWSCTQVINDDNTITINGNDVAAGPIYKTESGNHEFDVRVTKKTGLTITLNLTGEKNWGDGFIDSETSHTYENYGDYTIEVNGSITFNGYIMNQSSSAPNYTLLRVRIVEDYNLSYNATFSYCRSLESITIPRCSNTRNTGYDFEFKNCYSLKHFTFEPDGPISLISNKFNNCYNLKSVVIYNKKTSIGNYAFYGCSGLTSVTIPDSVTSIAWYSFYGCSGLTSVTIPDSVTSIGEYAFSNCFTLSPESGMIIPSLITSIISYSFTNNFTQKKFIFLGNIRTIESEVFFNCHSCLEYNFSNNTKVPTLSNVNAFNGINQAAKIIVPNGLYDDWIASTNWVDLADYIYKASEVDNTPEV